MSAVTFTNAQLVLPTEVVRGSLHVRDGLIHGMGETSAIASVSRMASSKMGNLTRAWS